MVRIVAPLALLVAAGLAHGQQVLKNEGWGSLSGKVTLTGDVPAVVDLTDKMKIHADKACCLDKNAKAAEKVDLMWVVDPKTKAVANVVVWIKAPKDTYFPLPPNYKPNKNPVVIDQPHCAFLPRVSAYQPVDIVNGKEVATGQKVLFKNSATVPHNTRAVGHPLKNEGFNTNLPPKTDLEKSFVPQLLPISIQCDVHPWMGAKLHVFDHPYFAITKGDGTYEIPQVPAGAEVSLMVYHEGVGWVLPELGKGKAVTLTAGKNVHDFEVKAPK
jgi:hypothetical protein